MNEIQKCRDYVIGKFNSDPLVNTITALPSALVDTNKETIYPVVNIDYKGSPTGPEDVVLFSCQIKALDQLDVYVENTDSKLKTDTNELDVMNETFNICQTFKNSFRKYNDDNIELFSMSDITKITDPHLNGLSGHEFNLVISIPNEGSAC